MLAQIRYLQPNPCISLRRQTQVATTKATSPYPTTPSTNALDPTASDRTPHPWRSNPHSKRGPPTTYPLPRFPPSEVFGRRPPARAEPFVSGRHPKTLYERELVKAFFARRLS